VDKVIVTILLMIGGVVASLAVFNGFYPAMIESSGAVKSATSKVSDRIECRIDIIQVGDNSSQIDAWVKNIGTVDIDSVERSDVFYGPEDNFSRMTYGGDTPPYWDYQFEGSYTQWEPTVTTRITVHLASAPSADTYIFKVVVPNGISDETTFSVD
jgi:hypothetical protein